MFLINPYILQATGNPLWDGLLAYYTADNTPNDATGNGNNLTLVNGATYDTGIINNGFSFDGVNDSAQYSGDIGVTGDFSWSFWAYLNTFTAQTGGVQSFNTRSLANGSFSSYFTPNNLTFQMKGTDGIFRNQASATTINALNWYHCVISFDNTAKTANVYIDGSLDSNSGTQTFTNCSSADLANGFDVGMRRTNIFLDGKIDELAFWDRQLTASNVTELYNSGSGLQYS